MANPDFSKLPGDPLAFFELGLDFDRDGLRRAYGRLIKQFRPDTHAQEFQQIRGAYEQLDSQLRYGGTRVVRTFQPQPQSVWESLERAQVSLPGTTTPKASPDSSPSPSPRSLSERLRQEPAAEVYRELKQKKDKTPLDFYTLAVLSDLVEPREALTFLKWLLTGLQQHREEPGLCRLLQEYLRTDVATAQLPQVLLTVAKLITNDRFYYFTESGWDRLLRAGDFALFRRTLASCENSLRDYRIAGKMAFYLHLFRAAIWLADDDWLDETIKFLEDNGQELRDDFELDLCLQLRKFAQQAPRFVNGNSLRKKIVDAVQGYCTLPPLEAMQIIIRTQAEIAADAYAVMNAFPVPDPNEGAEIWQVWSMVTSLVLQEIGREVPQIEPQVMERPTLHLLREMRDEFSPLIEKFGNYRFYVTSLCGGSLLFGPLVLLSFVFSFATVGMVAIPWIIGVIVGYRLYASPKWVEPWFTAQILKRRDAVYLSSWRPALFRHQQALAVPASAMLEFLWQTSTRIGDDEWLGAVLSPLMEDRGFMVYAAAQPFVR